MTEATIDTEERERILYGCTEKDLHHVVDRHVGPEPGKLFATQRELAFSILSDCQEEMVSGLIDRARKGINRAKWFLENEVD